MLVRPTRAFPGTAFALRGTAISKIWPWLLVISVVSTIVSEGYILLGIEGYTLTTIPFTLVGLALSIFLGFRNNACYDRWWEARKLWGRLINTTRSLSRQTLTMLHGEEAAEVRALQDDIVRRTIAYVHALKFHLRSAVGFDVLERFLPAAELETLKQRRNVPVALLDGLGARIAEARSRGWIDTYQQVLLEETLTDLTDIQGGCERIKNTPVPIAYTVLTHRIVGVYVFALPFGIVGDVGALTPLVVLIVAFAFLGLDSVGSQIEDPFEEDPNDLPLAAMARTIEIDLLQQLGAEEVPDPIVPVHGILL